MLPLHCTSRKLMSVLQKKKFNKKMLWKVSQSSELFMWNHWPERSALFLPFIYVKFGLMYVLLIYLMCLYSKREQTEQWTYRENSLEYFWFTLETTSFFFCVFLVFCVVPTTFVLYGCLESINSKDNH